MRCNLRRGPSPASVLALGAVFISLGGTSYAITQIGSRQIANNGVRSADLRNNDVRSLDLRDNDVRSVDIRNGSLGAIDFRRGALPRGPKGDTGTTGERGATGAAGSTGGPGPQGPAGVAGRDAATIVDGGDCDAIQAAINGLPAGGGAVLVRRGTYLCGASIVIDRDAVTLRGSGLSTVLKLKDHVNRPVIVVGQTAATPTTTRRGIAVSDLAIDGNRGQQDHECSSGPCGAEDVLRNNGISLRRVDDVVVERVSVSGARSGGLVTEHGSRRVVVRDFTASDNHFDGLAAYRTEDSLFTGLELHGNGAGPDGGAGLSFDLDFVGNTVANSVIAGSSDVGVFMRDSRHNIFSAVHVRDSGSFGLFVAENPDAGGGAASCNTFTGMLIARSGRNPAEGQFGMRFQDSSSTDNLVTAAQFVDNPGGAISENPSGLVTSQAVVIC